MVQRGGEMTERNVMEVSGAPEESKGENKKNITEPKVIKGHKKQNKSS